MTHFQAQWVARWHVPFGMLVLEQGYDSAKTRRPVRRERRVLPPMGQPDPVE
ncbi:MAG TPA: hypothetical protein PKK23_21475 [Nitrospirales bacterium]|nr:hypothetical protein [Nitrospirales bacterium]